MLKSFVSVTVLVKFIPVAEEDCNWKSAFLSSISLLFVLQDIIKTKTNKKQQIFCIIHLKQKHLQTTQPYKIAIVSNELSVCEDVLK